jgi:hypothetical protein
MSTGYVWRNTNWPLCQHINMNIKVNKSATDCTRELRESLWRLHRGSRVLHYYLTKNIVLVRIWCKLKGKTLPGFLNKLAGLIHKLHNLFLLRKRQLCHLNCVPNCRRRIAIQYLCTDVLNSETDWLGLRTSLACLPAYVRGTQYRPY